MVREARGRADQVEDRDQSEMIVDTVAWGEGRWWKGLGKRRGRREGGGVRGGVG